MFLGDVVVAGQGWKQPVCGLGVVGVQSEVGQRSGQLRAAGNAGLAVRRQLAVCDGLDQVAGQVPVACQSGAEQGMVAAQGLLFQGEQLPVVTPCLFQQGAIDGRLLLRP